ncbi:MAG: hypothetical protein KR126chlam6_00710 [Candidatus Anoxychlamydiales bacterium]|nr:hypothetical protein [Candidatus Anoxychlamydiales bacterium]
MKKTKKRKKTVKKTYKKPARKPTTKRKKTTKRKSVKKPIWEAHVQHMEKRINAALNKLKRDVKRKASYKIIEEDNNELLMLLGECNYIVREFHEKKAG